MKRRRFIALSVAAAVGVVLARFAGDRLGGTTAGPWTSDLFDERFESYVRDNALTEAGLLAILVSKGVITGNGALDAARVRQLAREDRIETHAGTFYTQTELELYAFAYLREKRGS